MDVIKVGQMRNRITIQTATVSKGDLGGEELVWTDSFTAFAFAEYRRTGSDEKYRAKQLTNRTDCDFTIRREDRVISAKDRVLYDGRIFDIDSVLRNGVRQEFYLLECFQMGEQKTSP